MTLFKVLSIYESSINQTFAERDEVPINGEKKRWSKILTSKNTFTLKKKT